MSATIFERIVTGGDVEQWCLAVLKRWSGTYLAELERQHDVDAGTYARVRSWSTAPSFDNWPEDQVPAVIVVSVGLAENPVKEGGGAFRARWQIGLACVVSARTQAEAHELAMVYVAAHRALLIQRPSLEGKANGVVWQDENYDDLPLDDLRSLGAGQAVFTVEVDGVTSAGAGPTTPNDPLDPDTDPWPYWPTVESVDVEVANYGSDPLPEQEDEG